MVRRRQRERSLFEVLLPDGHKLWPDWLRRIDTVLEDEAVIEVVAQALEARWPQSRRRGRPGTPAEVVIRMLILKHLFDWSYDDLEQEVRANLVYRAFTRIDAGEVPDAKTILKIAGALGPDVIGAFASAGGRSREAGGGDARPPLSHRYDGRRNQCALSDRQHVAAGRRARVDPHDGTGDTALGDEPGRIRNRLRSVTRGVLTIGYQARSPKTRDAMVQSYRKLMATTRAVLRDADTLVRRLGQRRRTALAGTASILERTQRQLRQLRPVVQRVVAQTRARLMGGDTHVPDKVLSIFEPHTTTIRKGKISKPNEFGNLVTLQESEHQIITAYEVHAGRPADVTMWTPALDRHQAIFARAPYLAAGDRGFSSATNEQAAADRGVRRVILPRRGPKSTARRAYERQAWFRRGQRWRVGCEGRISVIKRRHGLRRCRYHGTDGMARWVGLGVIADNLMNIATFVNARAAA